MSAYPSPPDPTAVIPKRYVAAVIDVGIGIVVLAIIFAAFSKDVVHYRYDAFGNYTSYQSRDITGAGGFLFAAFWLSYNIGVFVLWRGLTGRTLGTMAFGLVTVNEQGRPLGVGYALLRSVIGLADYFPFCCAVPVVGIITSNVTKGHRRVGDLVAKSFVVDKVHAGQPVAVPGVTIGAAVTGPYAQPYGQQPYGAPGATPYPPQPQYPGQPGYPGQPPYPAQPQYGAPAPTPAPAEPGTAWPTPAPAAPATPDDGSGWGAPGAVDTPAVETPPDQPVATPPVAAPETVEPTAGPEPEPAAPAEPAATAPELAADPTQPQWDPARNAYIQWDPDGQRWMQFDDGTQQWRPIS